MDQIIILIKSLKLSIVSIFTRKEKVITKIKKLWDGKVNKKRDFNLISLYYRLKTKSEKRITIDKTTWSDLNMDEIFSIMDRAASAIGSQYLYYTLHTYENDNSILKQRNRLYNVFLNNQELREKILIILYKLHSPKASCIVYLLFNKIPNRPRLYLLIYLSSLCTILSIYLISYYGIFLIVAMFLAIINLAISYFYGRKVMGYFLDMSHLGTMLKISKLLADIDIQNDLPQIETLKKHKLFAIALNKKMSWLIIDKLKLNDFAAALVYFLDYICLFNIVSFIRSINDINKNNALLIEIYEAIASLDAIISIASYIKGLDSFCIPNFNNQNNLSVNNIYHPILYKPVNNNFNLNNKSCLITGSNMAGKTTFIKTIGVNIIFAQTLSICLAKSVNIGQLIVKSSIKREDNLNENKSYYFKEIESILDFIKFSETEANYIFLIDEIFRGTNTIERLSASTSVLRFLGSKNITLVTTHDIELQDLLKGHFNMYHFSEQIDNNNNHYFDYKIKSGPCSSRNAIKLLELTGYPDSIIQNAYRLADQFLLQS